MKCFGWLAVMLAVSCSGAPEEFDWMLKSALHSGPAWAGAARLAIDPERHCYLSGQCPSNACFGTNVLMSSSPWNAFLSKYDTQSNCLWLRHIANGNATGVAAFGTDAVFIAGVLAGDTMAGSVPVRGRGEEDAFLAKYDSEGNLLWLKQAGGTKTDRATGVAVDSLGNSYITGEFRGLATFDSITLLPQGSCDFYVAKYDPAGRLLWARRDGGRFTEAQAIAVDRAGNVYATGVFLGGAKFGTQTLDREDMFLVKYDTDGNFLWAQAPGGSPGRVGYSLAVDKSGSPHVVGIIQKTSDFGSTNFVILDPGHHINIFLAKWSADGEFEWVRQFRNGDADFSNVVPIESVGVKRPGSVTLSTKSEPLAPLSSEVKAKAVKIRLNVATVGTPSQQSTQSLVLRAQKSGEYVVLFWPREFAGFVLEGSETLTPFPIWETVEEGPESIDGQLAVTIPIRDTAKFYRLRKP